MNDETLPVFLTRRIISKLIADGMITEGKNINAINSSLLFFLIARSYC